MCLWLCMHIIIFIINFFKYTDKYFGMYNPDKMQSIFTHFAGCVRRQFRSV